MITARKWIEKHYGRRPTELPVAHHRAKTRLLRMQLAKAIQQCQDDEIWDGRVAAVELYIKSAGRRSKSD